MKKFEKIYNKIILEEFNSEMIKHIHNAEKTQLSEGIRNICSKEIGITTPKLIIKEYLRAKINANLDVEDLQSLIRNLNNSFKEFNCDLKSIEGAIQYKILFKEFAESDNLDKAKDILARANYLNKPESISYNLTAIINILFFNTKKNYISDNINFDKIKKAILNFPYLNKVKYGWFTKNDNFKKEFDECINELKKIILPVYDKFFKTLFNETFEDILNYTASVEPDFLYSYYLDKYYANPDNQVDKCIAKILFELADNLHNIHGANMNNIETLKNKNLNVSVQPIIREILAELDASNVKDEDLLILSADNMSKYKNSKDLKIKYPLALFLNDLGEVKHILQFTTTGYFNKNLSKYLYSLRDSNGFYNLVRLHDNNNDTSVTAAFNDSNVTTLVAFPADILKKSVDKRQKRYQDEPFKTRENFDKYQKEQFANRLKVFKDTKNSRKLEEQIKNFINEIPNTLNDIKERLNNVNLIQADSYKQKLISSISNYLSEISALNERIKSNFESAKSNGSAVINNYWLSKIDDTADAINSYKNNIIATLDKLENE